MLAPGWAPLFYPMVLSPKSDILAPKEEPSGYEVLVEGTEPGGCD